MSPSSPLFLNLAAAPSVQFLYDEGQDGCCQSKADSQLLQAFPVQTVRADEQKR